MTLEQFQSTSIYVQKSMVKHHGSLLWEKESGCKAVYLYQVDGFYVEICCDHSKREILWIKPFDSPDQLEPYLEAIDISEVVLGVSGES